MTSIFLRSLVFNVLFYLLLAFWVLVGIPTYLMPRPAVMNIAKWWGQSSIWLVRVVCNIKVEFRGLEKIPAGPLIVAAKHQSMWETFALLQFFDTPLYILKRELKWIPIFGWYLIKADMIEVNRGAGGRTLVNMARRAGEEVRRGRQLIIFPEGTRTAVGAPPHYKTGVGQIYADCKVPCLPVAMNSGLFWPRRQFLRYPGTILVEFLDVMPAGMPRKEFLEEVAYAIETASNRLIEEGQREQADLFGRVPTPLSKPPQRMPSAPVY
jgi:1-acyl-sn-glycerol-3-phosphate acyltransferase